MEALGGACAIAFDKTGTLTSGQLEVTEVVPVGAETKEEIVGLAAAVEARSEHPVAKAVVAHAEHGVSRAVEPSAVRDFQSFPGMGVSARVDGAEIAVGTLEFFEGLAPGEPLDDVFDGFRALQELGRTVVLVARERSIIGMIALGDTVRANAAEVLTRLRDDGVHHLTILTGDQPLAAEAVRSAVGADEVLAGLKAFGEGRGREATLGATR